MNHDHETTKALREVIGGLVLLFVISVIALIF
jgi:hypothetical protein